VFTVREEAPKKPGLKVQEVVESEEEQFSIINVTSESVWSSEALDTDSFR
jgi:hypothetical protein